MATTIVSNTGSLVLNGGSSTVPKGGYTVSISNDKVYVKCGTVTWNLDFNDTTLDGSSYASAKELAVALSNFSKGGGDGQGVTWEDVTDKPAFLAEGATAAEARNAIGAGTSDYTLPAGGSATTYLAGDGTWKTPANTTYSVISETEFNTGSAATARAVSAQSLNRDIQAKVISYLSALPGFAAGASLQVNAAGDGFEWVTA